MIADARNAAVEKSLLWDWLAGHSLARGSPLPVPEHGGMRVDTASPKECRRYVFAGPEPGIKELAASIQTPRTFIKMCGPGERLLAMAPAGWSLQPRGYLMTHRAVSRPPAPLPPGYRLEVSTQGASFAATIFAKDETIAASGYAAEYGRAFVFDRISTHPEHRRRGLGKALMSALGAMQTSARTTQVLVATEEGRALYSSIGWAVVSIYSTIVIPDPDEPAAPL
jgi:GNAT superfamily N-acetyltransferase